MCARWPLRSLRMSAMRIIVLHPYSNFEVRRPARSEVWLIFCHGVRRPHDLDLWPFDLEMLYTSHRCHGQPSCQFSACYAHPFSTYGQARDRQTTAINPTWAGAWYEQAVGGRPPRYAPAQACNGSRSANMRHPARPHMPPADRM